MSVTMYGFVTRVAWFTMSWISASLPQAIRSPSKLSRRRQRTFSASFSLSPTPPGAPYRLHVVGRWTIKKDLFHRVQGLLVLLIFIQKCLHIIYNLASIKRNEHLVNSAASHVSWLMASLLAPSLPPLFGIVSSEPSWKPSAMRPWSLNAAWRNIISPFPTAFWGCEGCVQSNHKCVTITCPRRWIFREPLKGSSQVVKICNGTIAFSCLQ